MTPVATPADHQRRLQAFLLDQCVVVLPAACVAAALTSSGAPTTWAWLTSSAVAAVALTLTGAVAGATGHSPGRRLMGVRLVAADGARPLGAVTGAARSWLLTLAGLLTAGAGWWWLALSVVRDEHGRGRGWHDRLCGSLVVEVDVAAAAEAPVPGDPVARVEGLDVAVADARLLDLTALRLAQPGPVPAPRRSPRRPLPVRWQLEVEGEPPVEVTGRVRRAGVEVSVVSDGSLVLRDAGTDGGTSLVRGGAARTVEPGRSATLLPGDRFRADARWVEVLGIDEAVVLR